MDHRHNSLLKKGFGFAEAASGRRSRAQSLVAVRKDRKTKEISARRARLISSLKKNLTADAERSPTVRPLQQAAAVIQSADASEEVLIEALARLCAFISEGSLPLYDNAEPEHAVLWNIFTQITPRCTALLDSPGLRLRQLTGYLLRFVASCDHADIVAQAGCLPKALRLLQAEDKELLCHGIWILGNVASQSPELRAEVGRQLDLRLLLPFLRHNDTGIQRAAAWALRNILDNSDSPATVIALSPDILRETMAALLAALESNQQSGGQQGETTIASWRIFQVPTGNPPPNNVALARFLRQVDSERAEMEDLDINFGTGQRDKFLCSLGDLMPLEEIDEDAEEDEVEPLTEDTLTAVDSLWALCHLIMEDAERETEGERVLTRDEEALVVVLNTLQNLVLTSSVSEVLCPAIRALGSLVCCSGQTAKLAVRSGSLQAMAHALQHPDRGVREETCYLLANVAALDVLPIEVFLSTGQLVQRVVEQLAWASWDVKKEAAWAFCNMMVRASAQEVTQLLEMGVLEHLAALLGSADPQVQFLVLQAVRKILETDARWTSAMEEAELKDNVEALQYDRNQDVSALASEIYDSFFEEEDEEIEDAAVAPSESATAGTFTFGLSSQPAGQQTFNFGNPLT